MIFSSPNCLDWLWDPPSLLFNGHQGFFSRSKAVRRKIDHSPPPSTKLKMSEVMTPLHICLHDTQEQIYLFNETGQKVVDWIQKSDK